MLLLLDADAEVFIFPLWPWNNHGSVGCRNINIYLYIYSNLLHASSSPCFDPEALSDEGWRNYGKAVFGQGLSQQLPLIPVKIQQFQTLTKAG